MYGVTLTSRNRPVPWPAPTAGAEPDDDFIAWISPRLLGPHLLQLLERARPVAAQQAGEGTVGEQLAVGLAPRAVVALVRRVDGALHRLAAVRAGLAVPTVHG